MVAVAIHDEGGQAVAFAVDQATGRGAGRHRLAPLDRGRDAVMEE